MVPPILGDMIVRRIVVVAVRRMNLVTRKVFAITRNMKTVKYSSMTAGATHTAAPNVVAHGRLVNDGEANHEHHNDELVNGEAPPC